MTKTASTSKTASPILDALATAGKWTIGIGVALCVTGAFLWLPPARGFQNPELARIVALHLPNAAAILTASLVATYFGARYLLKGRDPMDDAKSKTAAALSALFCILTTVTGSIFAHVQWGVYWNWDPKQICITILLLIYAAYFVLRAGIEDPDKRGAVSAAYVLFMGVMTPMLTYVVPRLMPSLHPKNAGFDAPYLTIIGAMSFLLPGLFFWMQSIAVRYERVRLLVAERNEEAVPPELTETTRPASAGAVVPARGA